MILTTCLVGAVLLASGTEASKWNALTSRQHGFEYYINGTNSTTAPVELQITTKSGSRNKTSPLLYGWMIEDISHSIEGGLYGELLVNRAFQGSSYAYNQIQGFSTSGEDDYITEADNLIEPTYPTMLGYRSVGGARLTLDAFHPLSEALPTVLRVDIPLNATGEVGFLNEGWWGMQVIPQTYNASFYIMPYQARGNYSSLSGIDISLRSNLTGETWSKSRIPVGNLSYFDYTQLAGQIHNTVEAPYSNNTFAVTFDADEVRGATFYFGLISLFGETFKGRPNGMRKDLAEKLYELRPKFLRCPGGNNIEGESIATRWIWNNTIGPLKDRKGRPGDWNYYGTGGFGLLEYLNWIEDFEMEPVLAIYSGYSLDHTSYPEDRMDEVLQSALDELEFCMGDTSTKWGAKRAEYGHPEPFEINYVELGNEDWFSNTYPYRFPILYNGIKAKYPNLTLISTAYNEAPAQGFNYTIDLPKGSMWDTHHYEEPTFFLESFDFWDNWQESTNNTDVTVLIGEYSNIQIDTPSGQVNYSFPANVHIFYPELMSAVAEAVYLLGAERNPNTVKMTAYAPSLGNYNMVNWTPNLVTFTANPNETVLSASFYSQKLLNTYRGTETLPIKNTKGPLNPLWWAASIEDSKVYLKVVNSGNQSVPLTTNLDTAWSNVNGSILTGPDPNGYNFFNNETALISKPINNLGKKNRNGGLSWNVPAFSISVIQFDI